MGIKLNLKVQVHMRWWVRPYIFGCTTFAALTGSKPDVDKIVDHIGKHGLYYTDPDYREPYLANLFISCSLIMSGCNVFYAVHNHFPNGDSGLNIFAAMFLVLHYMSLFHFARSRR